MKTHFNANPRTFTVGSRQDITIKDYGQISLEPDEQVVFVTDSGSEFDVARKSWGFYATPSTNGRLKRNGFRSALVRNSQGMRYVLLIEVDKMDEFQKYSLKENLVVTEWLDEV